MVLKQIDDKTEEINTLKKLLQQSSSESQKKLIQKDLKAIEEGYKAEKENAYYLDFYFKEKENSILLHDIRLDHNGKTAQFDHILITPTGISILESKKFSGVLTINKDGSLAVKYKTKTIALPSPIEQNNRHKMVLEEFIEDKIEIPSRVKLMGGLLIDSMVLVHPSTIVTNKVLPKGFIRSDQYVTKKKNEIEELNVIKTAIALVKLINNELANSIAQELIKAHKPIKFDYTKKYKISINKICPRCKQGQLVKRKRKSEKYESKYKSDEFFGCSRFPKCRYTEEI